jgi:uncharacterized membrane protein
MSAAFLRGIQFELAPVLGVGALLAVLLLALMVRRLLRQGVPAGRAFGLALLRAAALAIVVVLLARPVRVESGESASRPAVAVLLDRSRSMGLVENGRSRFGQAEDVARKALLPALESAGFRVEPVLFAESSRRSPPREWEATVADGTATDLGAAIAHGMSATAPPPVAVVALTDGVANEAGSNRAALQALVDAGAPFLGIGFGKDGGVSSLSLQRVEAPPAVAPKQRFQVTAQLQATADGELPAFDLVLMRDGRFHEKRRVAASQGSRFWTESFRISEEQQGLHDYAIELVLPSRKDLVSASTTGSARVQVTEEREFRVLFAQGALTWDFKFIGRALRSDPGVRLTGLSRTSKQSVFRQNVESAGELDKGFPETLEEIAPYRVAVLSDLKPADLTPSQQEVVARFASELGGGVLLLGGPQTFDGSWQGSRLEQLLPVTFDPSPGVLGLDRPFHLTLTPEALRHPMFQVADGAGAQAVWAALPTFTQYGRVLGAKPAATVWAVHDEDTGPNGPRILMASQVYGAGLSAVVCVQNMWRWRLARDADPQQFDRFWRQLFRYLGQASRQDVTIELQDQELRPRTEIHVVLERQPRPERGVGAAGASADRFTVSVSGPGGGVLSEESMELVPLRPTGIAFRAEKPGVHVITVKDARRQVVASRRIEIRELDVEMQRTGRDMENLRQWAGVSRGLAVKSEEAGDGASLVAELEKRIDAAQREKRQRSPLGLDGWTLGALVLALAGEWGLRRAWGLP